MTLIELMAALGIMSILASVGYGWYAAYAERVRVTEAVSEIGRIELAIAAYATRPDRLAGGLPANLSELGLEAGLTTDPWGRPYQYRRDAPTLSPDYDLYSLGRDGASDRSGGGGGSRDDIVRGAGGSFIGRRADFAAVTGAETSGLSTPERGDHRGAAAGSPVGDRRFMR